MATAEEQKATKTRVGLRTKILGLLLGILLSLSAAYIVFTLSLIHISEPTRP